MLFPNPAQKPIKEQTDQDQILLKEVLNDQPIKIKKIEENLFKPESPTFTD